MLRALVVLALTAILSAQSPSLLGTQWVQVGAKPTLVIAADGRISGRAPCNRFFAESRIRGSKIKLFEFGSTRMGCPDEVMRAEQEYLDSLQLVEKWQIEGGELVMTGKKLMVALRFRKS